MYWDKLTALFSVKGCGSYTAQKPLCLSDVVVFVVIIVIYGIFSLMEKK